MSVAETKPKSLTTLAADAGPKSGLDWVGLHARLNDSRVALEQKLTPGPEERQKILRARARLLAAGDKTKVSSPHLLLEVVEFVLGPERYGIESSRIREIYPLHEFTV